MAGLTVVQSCSNVFKQVSRYLSGNSPILNITTVTNNGLKKYSPVSVLQVRYKMQKMRFKDPKAGKEKSYVYQRKKSSLKKMAPKEDSPNFLARKPMDNIWIRKFYPQQTETFEVAIGKHKEYADPTMLNNMNGLIYADMQLNMKTKKKTKFLGNVKSTLSYPHKFDAGPAPRCLVLSDNAEDVEKALAGGATFAGGADLILQLKQEAITRSMYDHALCTPGIYSEVMAIRPLFKEKLPHQKRGSVGPDVETMLNTFLSGVSYESTKIYEDVGSLQVPFGQLYMDEDHLLENFQKLVHKLCHGRSEKLGPFITEIHIIAPPSPEKFQLTAALYVPGYDMPIVQEEEEPSEETDDENVQEKKALRS